jgi:hypothetical protein
MEEQISWTISSMLLVIWTYFLCMITYCSSSIILVHRINTKFIYKYVHKILQNEEKKGFSDCCGNEMLQVRAYGQAYISLEVNIRSVRFGLILIFTSTTLLS